jgi:uncharacterized delta-60 repeat protein
MKKQYATFLTLLLAFAVLQGTYAQAGALDATFNPGSGANNGVWAVRCQNDGKIIIAGSFGTYNNVARNNIARLNPDGSLDITFNISGVTFNPATPSYNRKIDRLAIQNDGKILVAGAFTHIGGVSRNRIARLNSDGSLDTTFNPGNGPDSTINVILLQNDGKIVVGGKFSNYNGFSRQGIARIDSSGNLDTTFSPPILTPLAINVTSIVAQADGKLIYNPETFVRLMTNGTVDISFNAPGSYGIIALQSTGKIIGNYNDTTTFYHDIVRYNIDGSIDSSFLKFIGGSQSIYKMIIQDNNKIVIYSPQSPLWVSQDSVSYTVNGVYRLNENGKMDTTFSSGIGPDGSILDMSAQGDGKILIAGHFLSYYGIVSIRTARIYTCNLPPPSTVTGTTSHCPGFPKPYSVDTVIGADSYVWVLPSGWSGLSDSCMITATSGSVGGTITVMAHNNNCGNSSNAYLSVDVPQIPNVPICMVTIDSGTTYPVITWHKPSTTVIDSFRIYRTVANDSYSLIGSFPYSFPSVYYDNTAAPYSNSYKYKLSVLDSCGNESMSDFHNTIHLQYIGLGNFNWTNYFIGDSVNPIAYYHIYRDDISNGNFVKIHTLSGSNYTFTDLTYLSYPHATYYVKADWNGPCSFSQLTVRSNSLRVDAVGLTEFDIATHITVYPNPANTFANITLVGESNIESVEIVNALGQIFISENNVKCYNGSIQILVNDFAPGLYNVHVKTKSGRVIRKLIVE